MKYSELDAYLELARWENERDDYHIKVYRNGYTVAEVGLWEQYNIRILDPTQMTEGLYRRLTELAKTPLAEREEEKQYRLWLSAYGASDFDLYRTKGHGLGGTNLNVLKSVTDPLLIFTESEIAELDIDGFEKVEVTE